MDKRIKSFHTLYLDFLMGWEGDWKIGLDNKGGKQLFLTVYNLKVCHVSLTQSDQLETFLQILMQQNHLRYFFFKNPHLNVSQSD